MQFGVLGQVIVIEAGQPIPLKGWKQVALLSALLSRANTAVSVPTLIEALWGTTPPASAEATLRWHVHQLRTTLADSTRVERARHGYRLVVRPDELDAERFERLAAEGRHRLEAGDAERASALLHNALALWRGPAYADLVDHLDRHPVYDEAARLDELRLVTHHHQIEADLELGRHSTIVGQLRGLVAQHPLREGFRAQLMLALYRSGRQSEALEVYRQGRRLLADELGIDPGPKLRSMEQAILTADPKLDLAPATIAPTLPAEVTRPAVPAQLPIDPPGFTGRVSDIKRLVEHFSGQGGAIVLFGPGGVGKSALAVHLGQLLADRFPDGQLYANLHGSTPGVPPLDPREVLSRFIRSVSSELLHSASSSVDELAGTYRSVTAGKRILVVLDDAADVAQIWPLLPGSATCAVIVTSRRALPGGIPHHRLSPLPEAEAVELLAHLIGDDRTADNARSIAEIARLCDRLPLALCVTAARLVAHPTWPPELLAERLRDERRRLDELMDGDRAVRASFAMSYQDLHRQTPNQVGSAATRVFRLAGLLDIPDLSLEAVAALADLSPQRTEVVLDALVSAQLVENDLPGRYTMHDLLRLFAREQAAAEETEADRTEALLRVFRLYVRTAREASIVVRPMTAHWVPAAPDSTSHGIRSFTTVREAIEWTKAELGTFQAVAGQAAETPGEGPGLAIDLAAALVGPLGAAGWGGRQRALSDVASAAAHRTGEPGHLAVTSYMNGLVLHANDPEEAARQLRTAQELWSASGNRFAEALALQHLATSYGSLGRFDESLDCLTRSMQMFRRLASLEGEASTLDHLGLAYRRLGRNADSVAAYRRSLQLSRKLGDHVIEAIAATNLATVMHLFGDLDEAIPTYELALELCREHGNRQVEAECLWGLADAYGKLGQSARRDELLRRATDLLRELGFINRSGQQVILNSADPPVPPGFWTNV